MYDLPYHKEDNATVILSFMRKYAFASVSGCDAMQRPVATQLPLLVQEREGKITLSGHLMKEMDHHKAFSFNPNVLAVFTGPHSYVSGTWYTNPNTPSTWNYMSVHAHGKMRFVERQQLEQIMQSTSLKYEKDDQTSPTVFHNLPKSFTERALNMIVGFEIEVTELKNVFKLSQDRDHESYKSIVNRLSQMDSQAKDIAHEMKIRQNDLFESKEP